MAQVQTPWESQIKDTAGKPLHVSVTKMGVGGIPYDEETEEIWTLGSAVERALTGRYQDEPALDGEEKFKRGALALHLAGKTGLVELTAEELVLIKRLTGKAFGPVMVARLWQMLEAKPGQPAGQEEGRKPRK